MPNHVLYRVHSVVGQMIRALLLCVVLFPWSVQAVEILVNPVNTRSGSSIASGPEPSGVTDLDGARAMLGSWAPEGTGCVVGYPSYRWPAPDVLSVGDGASAVTLRRTCSAGEWVQTVWTKRLTQCSDGLDNDADGKIDMNDGGCSSPSDDDEHCPSGKDDVNGQCLDPCPSSTVRDPSTLQCMCPTGKEDVNGQCMDKCKEGEQRNAQGQCVGPECPEDKIGVEGVTVNQTYEQNGNDFCLSGTHCRISSTLLHSTSLAFDCSALGTPGGVCVPSLKTYAYRYKIVGTDSQFCAPSSPKAKEDVGPPEASQTSHDGTEVKTKSNGTVSFVSMAKPGGIYSADGPDNGVAGQPAVPSAAVNDSTKFYSQTIINNSTNKSSPDGPNNPNNPNNQTPTTSSNDPPSTNPGNPGPPSNNPDAGCSAGQKRNLEMGNCVCIVGTKDIFGRCIGDNGCPIGQVKSNSGQCVSGTTGGQCPTGYVCSAPDGVCTPSQHQQSGMWDVDCVNEGGGGNDGAGLSGGTSCDAAPTCTGDPVGCYTARQNWSIACAYQRPTDQQAATAWTAATGPNSGQQGNMLPVVGAVQANQWMSGLNIGGGACPSDISMNLPLYSQSFTIPLSSACGFFRFIRALVLIGALVLAYRIYMGAFGD